MKQMMTRRTASEVRATATVSARMVQCPKCKNWFASDTYTWKQHRRSCNG
jgi:phage FluMu protein Com